MGIERYWLLVLFLFSVRSLCSLNVGLLLSWASSVRTVLYYLAFVLSWLRPQAHDNREPPTHYTYGRAEDSREQLACLPMEAIVLLS